MSALLCGVALVGGAGYVGGTIGGNVGKGIGEWGGELIYGN